MSAYEDYLSSLAQEDTKRKQLTASLGEAATVNPDDFANQIKLSRAASISLEALPQFKEEAQQAKLFGEVGLAKLWKDAPKTSEFLSNPDHAKLSSDDTANLSGFEQAANVLKNSGRALAQVVPRINAGIYGAASAPFELVGADTIGGFFRGQQKNSQAWEKHLGPQGQSSGNIESGWYSGLTSAGQNLLSLPMALLPGGQGAALAAMTIPIFGDAYGKARDKGLSPLQGINYGTQDAAAEWAGEKLGLGNLVKNIKGGSGFGKTLFEYLVREVPSEMATTLAQSFNEYTNINPDKPVGEWLKQLPDEMAQTVVATLVGGGAVTTTVKVAEKAMQAIAGKQEDAQQAGQMGELLGEMNKLAEASKLRLRDTETAQGFFQSILDEGRDSIYITPEALAQSGLAEQMAQTIPAVAEQLQTANESGHDIRIPIADLMATMAGPELAQSILPHVAVEPGGFTPTTAQEYLQSDKAAELQAEVERVLGEKEGDDTFKASAQVVKNTVKEQLTVTGRFAESVNDAYSSMVGNFYAVQAARMGSTPEAMFQRYPLRIGAQSAIGQQFEQGGTLADVSTQLSDSGIKNAISEKDGIITLSQIVVPESERGTGKGTAAMQALIEYADRTGQHVALSPSGDFGGNKKRLVEFYKRFGFVENKGKNRAFTTSESMYRQAAGKVLHQSAIVDQQIEQWANGKLAGGVILNLGRPSATLQSFGMSDLPIHLTQGILKKAVGKHNVDAADLKGLVAAIQSPLAVLASKKGEGHLVVLTELQHKDGNIIAALDLDTMRREIAIHDIRSLHPKDTDNLMDWVADGLLLGYEKTKGRKWLDGNSESNSRRDQVMAALANSRVYEAGGEYNQQARGSFNPATLQITLLKNADLSTFLHESGHFFLEVQADLAGQLQQEAAIHGADSLKPGEQQVLKDMQAMLDWFGIKDLAEWNALDFEEKRSYHEKFARGFESYLFEGKAPSIEMQGLFQRFRAWMLNVYRDLKALDVELTDEVRGVFDRMLATSEQITLAEQGRSMMPLFTGPEQAGMTPAEFADYQALGVDATNEAIEDLQARGLRDMQWIHNARGRIIKQLQKESAAKRAEVQMQVRAEVMRQPIYRAWQFLTGKITADDRIEAVAVPKSDPNVLDETIDPMFAAIAKLGGINKADVVTTWGIDPKDKPTSGLFGKPLWRIDGGLSIDGMAEALSQYGYLEKDENGKWDIRELEAKFKAELAGDTQYSTAYDYAGNQPVRPGDQVANLPGLAAGRFDLASLSEIGLPAEIVQHLKTLRMTSKEGIHPDIVAEMFGFSSGDELARRLAIAEAPKAEIEALTDQRMLEQFGDLSSEEAIKKAADRAIHNDVRARMVATELAMLEKATGNRRTLASAAKEYAAAMIARLKVRDIKPGQYASAEVRAGKAAEKASKSGDVATAAAEKRNQLINTYATRAAYDAEAEVENHRLAWSKFSQRTDDKLKKSYDMDLVNAVRAILGEYGIAPKKAERARDYLKTVEANDPEIYAVVSASIDAALNNAKPFRDMTVEEVRGLADEIDAILHLARRSRQMEIDGDLIDRQEVQDALTARMVEIGIPNSAPGDTSAITEGESRMAKFRTAVAALTRVESWVGRMDGDGNAFGPFRRFIHARIKDAAIAYQGDKARVLRQYRALLDSIAPTLKQGLVFSPELNYTFGKDTGGSSINEIVHAILHTGNQSNQKKMLLGRGWATENADGSIDTSRWEAFIKRMVAEGKITQAHFDFAQGVWDLLEATKPLAQKTHRDVFGKYFDEVTAEPFTDPFGIQRAGGYVPAQADARIVPDANLRALTESENASMAFAFPTTAKGFTKGRVEYNRPLLLDLKSLAQHIDKVLLFSHMEMPVRDVQRVLSAVSTPLNRIDPAAIPGLLKPWLNRAARQQVTTPITADAGLSRFLTVARSRAGMAAMFGNVANTLQQITGFSLASLKVKPALMLSATADYMKHPKAFAEAVAEASPYMAQRMENEVAAMTDDINTLLLNPTLLEKGQAWATRHAYFMQSAFDNVMSPIIWTAAYNQAIEQKLEHKDAVRLGDAAVRETQGAMSPEDVSRIESGQAWARLFTQFAGYFNMQANLLGTEYAKLMQSQGLRKGAGRGVFVFTFGFLVPAVVGELIIQAFRGGPGDDDKDGQYLDDWLAALFFWAPLRTVTAMVPGVGQMANSVINAANNKPYDDRLASSPAISMLESSGRVLLDHPIDLVNGKLNLQKAVRDVATLISMTVGIPANLAARPIGYLSGMADNKIQPTGPADLARGLVTGTASPESKR